MGENRSRRRKSYGGQERRATRIYPRYLVLAILGAVGIAAATLCPIEYRPHVASANVERFGAYFALGVMAALAAPRQQTLVALALVALAFGLEGAQLLVPTRDGTLPDAIVKAFGGMLGAQFGVLTFSVRRWLKQTWRQYMATRRSSSRSAMRYERSL
ncbi:MAG TPA: hypothetical protein VMU59_13250 [Caulobacteraceae bacterium]|nr:hypothetical protein [Caulobacteraceae bacterium]